MGQSSAHTRLFVTYLDHDHSERENVRLLAIWRFVQYLRRSPPRGTALTLGALRRIQVMSDSCEAKVCDTRIVEVVHEDVQLDTCQCGDETGLERPHTPLRSP